MTYALPRDRNRTKRSCFFCTFLSIPIQQSVPEGNLTERSITPDSTANVASSAPAGATKADDASLKSKESLRQDFVQDLLNEVNPKVLKKVTDAAFQATSESLSGIAEARSAAILGLATSQALKKARVCEDAVAAALSQLVNQRMQKLENRMALMEDVEGVLEAERLSLELERRDLYTTRCRYWFGGA